MSTKDGLRGDETPCKTFVNVATLSFADLICAPEGFPPPVERPLALHHGQALRDRAPRKDHRLDPEAEEGPAERLWGVHVPGNSLTD